MWIEMQESELVNLAPSQGVFLHREYNSTTMEVKAEYAFSRKARTLAYALTAIESREVMRAIQSALSMNKAVLSIPDVLATIRGGRAWIEKFQRGAEAQCSSPGRD